MPEHEIDFYHCGTNVAGWLNGIHPEEDGKVLHPEYCKKYACVLVRFFSKSEKSFIRKLKVYMVRLGIRCTNKRTN